MMDELKKNYDPSKAVNIIYICEKIVGKVLFKVLLGKAYTDLTINGICMIDELTKLTHQALMADLRDLTV